MEDNNLVEIQHRLWAVEQDILDEIHRVCTENGLRYSLAYGTLLGAVRHKGFIPWDDDVDVMMPREDYDQLVRIWDACADPNYIFQTEECSDDYNNNFGKVRKDHTAFIMYEEQKQKKFHKGIYVDIFPMVRQAPGKITKKYQFAMFMVNLLYNRGYTSGHKGTIGLIERLMLAIVPKKYYRKLSLWAGKQARRWQDNTSGCWLTTCTFIACHRLHPADFFDSMTQIDFQGKSYNVIHDYHGYLTAVYGDYMKLPPEEERVWTHHPIEIDFSHNYEELPQR